MKAEASKVTDNASGTENKTSSSKTTKAPVQKAVDAAKEKADLKQQIKKEKPVYNLEATLEVLSNLQTKMRQRRRLLETVEKLENFVIETEKDEDELGGGHFTGCSLKIEDDNHNQFKTNNPVVIDAVTQFIKEKCESRLTEIEADIVLP
ncbi:MAG: hypothetical protein BGO31_10910 [Bacteroidetes bacterium 43-16]|uniref:hypothetical protein n=1 Tax=uncultured Dysgonomonas sp. TaxID=206096 RepID=UPI00092B7015|nr:hypothetical protein [uncultured Dysgonomonas sp.]OJV50969.1 MAG: hypothetical protein BGO31_10910 [Bacteroidetes bacterium 43-16]